MISKLFNEKCSRNFGYNLIMHCYFHSSMKKMKSLDMMEELDTDDMFYAPRSNEYYAEQQIERNYFYALDTRGQVYLEDTLPRNIATCIKDKKFLKFFFQQLRINNTGTFIEYPYVSMCGKERNFLCPVDPLSSIVYTDLISSKSNINQKYLLYGGVSQQDLINIDLDNLERLPYGVIKYNPLKLTSSDNSSNRLYYPIMQHKYLSSPNATSFKDMNYGLLHPHLCQLISQHIEYNDDTHTWDIHDNNEIYQLNVLSKKKLEKDN